MLIAVAFSIGLWAAEFAIHFAKGFKSIMVPLAVAWLSSAADYSGIITSSPSTAFITDYTDLAFMVPATFVPLLVDITSVKRIRGTEMEPLEIEVACKFNGLDFD